jgi:GTP-binding protein LepA
VLSGLLVQINRTGVVESGECLHVTAEARYNEAMNQSRIRNFCIVAHIDHGKSTLADRLLELTGTLSAREMTEQVLDTMDLEREKGVTIKASAVRMTYQATDNGLLEGTYQINLIDTPGHVDFSYEVSRALNACEGALLVVDASQGIEAQTLANVYLALEADLEIIPVINKIDMLSARPDEVAQEIEDLLGVPGEDILRISAKEGTNAQAVLKTVVDRVPPPSGDPEAPLRALIFDSHYDSYKGVVAYVRVVDGMLDKKSALRLMATDARTEPVEVGVFSPRMSRTDQLGTGEVGYVATGFKSVRECRVGDTITDANRPASKPLPGYQPAKPMVFAGLYPSEGEDYALLRDALEKLQLNDAALAFEPETSQALNYGFRCGFLGMFHLEIIQERLEREYGLDVVVTAPSVEYELLLRSGEIVRFDKPSAMPDEATIVEIREPWMRIQVFTPERFYGVVMELTTQRRGQFIAQEYPTAGRVVLEYDIPLSELITDYFDHLKTSTRGYASLDYRFLEYRAADLVRLDVLVNEQPVDALAMIVHRDQAYHKGQKLVSKLKELIPRQLFTVPIQAAAGNRIISRANVKALRKDVLSKCYGGDVTRKRKLLEKQKKGKKRLKMIGSVEVPQEAFMALLSLEDD